MSILEGISQAFRGSPRRDESMTKPSQNKEEGPSQEGSMETEVYHKKMSVDNQNNKIADTEMANIEDKANLQKNEVLQHSQPPYSSFSPERTEKRNQDLIFSTPDRAVGLINSTDKLKAFSSLSLPDQEFNNQQQKQSDIRQVFARSYHQHIANSLNSQKKQRKIITPENSIRKQENVPYSSPPVIKMFCVPPQNTAIPKGLKKSAETITPTPSRGDPTKGVLRSQKGNESKIGEYSNEPDQSRKKRVPELTGLIAPNISILEYWNVDSWLNVTITKLPKCYLMPNYLTFLPSLGKGYVLATPTLLYFPKT